MSTGELSPRESEIADLAIRGLTNDAIALQLDLSVGTVNTYWLRIRP
ncbi:MAG: helix-turn-helix transcriptional regulator [Fimbriimonadaceae bacterium]